MTIFNQIKGESLANSSIFQGTILYAITFMLLAWFAEHALRLAVQRLLAHDKRNYVDRVAVKFRAVCSFYSPAG
jgi:hypothetical protein